MPSNELRHYGVPGMKWGVRRSSEGGASNRTHRLAAKDAKRHADAKMFYGKGAGTRRKLLNAELEKKKKDIPGYEDSFNKSLSGVDMAKSANKAKRERTRKDVTYRTRVTTKQLLGLTAPITVTAATIAYQMNKPRVDAFVQEQGSRLISEIRNATGR